MSDGQQLAITFEARFERYMRNFERAQQQTDRRFRAMENRAKQAGDRMERTLRTSAANINRLLTGLGVGIFSGGFAGMVRGARSVVAEFSEMAKAADRVGLSTRHFQELEFGMKLAGIEANAFRMGMDQFTDRIGEAATRGGRLADILKANGVALRDNQGRIRPTIELLREYANLVKNAASENEAMVLTTEAFGDRVGRQMVTALRNGEAAIDDMARATEEAGGVIEEELLRRAEQFDDRWTSTWRRFEINGKSAVMNVITALDDFMAKADQVGNHSIFRWMAANMPTIGGADLTWMDPDLARAHGQALGPDARINDAFRSGATDALSEADQALVKALQDRYGVVTEKATATIIPTTGDREGRGGAGGRNRAAEAALREAEAVSRLIENLEHELSLIGATDLERAKAIALRQAGAAATEEQRTKIEQLVEAIHREKEALERSTEAASAMRDALGGALMDLVPRIETGNTALDRLLNTLIEIVAQAALLGTGPLGGMFGGGLMKLFGFADGGYVGGGGGKVLGFADGGHVRGPGTSTSDSIPARLSAGEYVLKASAVRKIGVDMLDRINSGEIAAFASGGMVGDGASDKVARLLRPANDDAPLQQINISAPVTVNANGGSAEQNADLAAKVGKELEATMRGVVVDELRRQSRPGNTLSRRGQG